MGVAVCVWLGTKYDCKPIVDVTIKFLADHAPKKK